MIRRPNNRFPPQGNVHITQYTSIPQQIKCMSLREHAWPGNKAYQPEHFERVGRRGRTRLNPHTGQGSPSPSTSRSSRRRGSSPTAGRVVSGDVNLLPAFSRALTGQPPFFFCVLQQRVLPLQSPNENMSYDRSRSIFQDSTNANAPLSTGVATPESELVLRHDGKLPSLFRHTTPNPTAWINQ